MRSCVMPDLPTHLVQELNVSSVHTPPYIGYEGGDPRIFPSFSTAAYRFGHTLIQERFRRADHNYHYDDSLMLSSVSY